MSDAVSTNAVVRGPWRDLQEDERDQSKQRNPKKLRVHLRRPQFFPWRDELNDRPFCGKESDRITSDVEAVTCATCIEAMTWRLPKGTVRAVAYGFQTEAYPHDRLGAELRALGRLAAAHRDEFAALVEDEMP